VPINTGFQAFSHNAGLTGGLRRPSFFYIRPHVQQSKVGDRSIGLHQGKGEGALDKNKNIKKGENRIWLIIENYRAPNSWIYLAVFLNLFSPGFEGPDMRYMAVTGLLEYESVPANNYLPSAFDQDLLQ